MKTMELLPINVCSNLRYRTEFDAFVFGCRAGGDWSTTYAPSPFYMTSKMRSLYLEGYDYSVFDLTKHDKVQIQVVLYSNCFCFAV